MTIEFDCSKPGLVVIIQGIICNCNSQQQKQQICATLHEMNSDELLCRERTQMKNPNLPPYDWSVVPLINGISIVKGANVGVDIFANSQDLPLLNSIFQKQINEGIAWCKAPALS